MFELGADNAAGYLAARPEYRDRKWRITPLGGGVSNTVLLAESGERRLVLKQSLPKLRVAEEWLADRSRIHRECGSMRSLRPHLPDGVVPEILFEDTENCLFAMEAAPAAARTWKSLLLEGEADEWVAETVAKALGAMFRVTWKAAAWESEFGDQTAFDQLRLDPYYRFTARKYPDLAEYFEARIRDARNRRCCLVHGDWSPKNFLVDGGSVMAIDFEVIHYGDPCFDAAFLLNHLVLKSFHRPQWADRYRRLAERFREVLVERLPAEATWFEAGTCRHLGCLLLARIDGKSPAEYIREDSVKQHIRAFARQVIVRPPTQLPAIFGSLPS